MVRVGVNRRDCHCGEDAVSRRAGCDCVAVLEAEGRYVCRGVMHCGTRVVTLLLYIAAAVITGCLLSIVSSSRHHESDVTKGTFHQRRSNLGSAEPGSTLIVDLNQFQAMMHSTNVKLG